MNSVDGSDNFLHNNSIDELINNSINSDSVVDGSKVGSSSKQSEQYELHERSEDKDESVVALSKLISASSVPSFVKDSEFNYRAVSPAFAALFGKQSTDWFVGKSDKDIFKDNKVFKDHRVNDEEVFRDEEDVSNILLPGNTIEDGKTSYLLITKRIIRGADGKAHGICGSCRDFTNEYEAKMRYDRQLEYSFSLPGNSIACALIDITEWKLVRFILKNKKNEFNTKNLDELIEYADSTVYYDDAAHDFFRQLSKDDILEVFNSGRSGEQCDFLMKKEDASVTWVKYEYFFLVSPLTGHIGLIVTVYDINAQHSEKENLIRAAEQDSMTGLLNHEASMRKINLFLNGDGANTSNALFIIDIDNFKLINDNFGHHTGDKVLIDVAKRIKQSFRESDIVGRIGGDEFIVLMKKTDDKAKFVYRKAQQLIENLQYECSNDEHTTDLTASIGISIFKAGEKTLEELYIEADAALYRAKKAGKNRISFSDESDLVEKSSDPDDEEISSTIHFKTLLNGIDGVLFVTEIVGETIKVVYSSSSEYGKDSVELIVPEDYQELKSEVFKCINDKTALNFTFRINKKDATAITWCHISGHTIRHDSGPLRMINIVTDITPFKNTEALLREKADLVKNADSRYAKLMENFNGGFIIFKTVFGNITDIVYANDGFLRMVGFDSAEQWMEYRNTYGIEGLVHPDDIHYFRNELAQSISEKRNSFSVFRLKRRDSSCIWVSLSASFAQQEDGSLIVYGVYADIDELKKAEIALEAENMKSSLALSLTKILVWEYDCANQTIYPQGSDNSNIAVRLPFFDSKAIYPESITDYQQIYKDINNGSPEGTARIHFRNFFGRNAWMDVSYKSIIDDNGTISGALLAANDITELMKAKSQYDVAMRDRDTRNDSDVSSFHINLTTDTYINGKISSGFSNINDVVFTSVTEFTEFFISRCDTTEAMIKNLRAAFNRESLLEAFENGITEINDEEKLFVADDISEWCRFDINMMINPATNDVEAICYIKNINEERISQAIIDRLVDFEYEMIALINVETREIHLLRERAGHKKGLGSSHDFDKMLESTLDGYIVENEVSDSINTLSLNNVIKELASKKIFTTSFSVYGENHVVRRKKWQFAYLDNSHRFISIAKSDITDQYQSEFDTVSGLYNRPTFYRRVRQLLNENPAREFVIVRWDIDKFKIFNDTFGMTAGDELLATIGNAYRSYISHDRIIGNLGADNFAICLPSTKFDSEDMLEWIRNLFDNFSEAYSFSVHMAAYRVIDPKIEVSIMCDRALIAVKAIKDNTDVHFTWFEDSMRANVIAEQNLLSELRTAIKEDQFVIFIQPQYNQITHEIVSGEVLVRWNHPQKGIIPPGVFIPTLEKSGLINHLDEIVWEKTCQFIQNRIKAKLPIVPLAVNVSRRDFYNPNLYKTIVNLVTKYKIDPHMLDLEITESAYIENSLNVINVIKKFRAYGFAIKMDDFGSGYSSLNTLKDIPVDMLKLDMRFLSTDNSDDEDAIRSGRGGIIINSVIRMAHWLNLPVIAEGVETARQADFLKTVDCAIVQGYYFYKPMPSENFAILLDKEARGATSVIQINSQLDNAEFWNPEAQATLIFNTFIGAAGIFDFTDSNFTALRLNDKFFEETHISPNNMNWHTFDFLAALHPDDRDLIDCALSFAKESTEENSIEARWRCFDKENNNNNQYMWLRLKVKRIAKSNHRAVVYVSVENITKRKNLESSSLDLGKRLNTILDILPGGIMLFEISKTSVSTLFYSSRVPEMFGYNKETYDRHLGKHPFDAVYSDDIPVIKAKIAYALEHPNEALNANFRHLCFNGRYRWTQLICSKLTQKETSNLVYAIVLDIDDRITELKTLQSNIQESNIIAQQSGRYVARYNIQTGSITNYFEPDELFNVKEDCNFDSLKSIIESGAIADNSIQYLKRIFNDIRLGVPSGSMVFEGNLKNGNTAKFHLRYNLVFDENSAPTIAIITFYI